MGLVFAGGTFLESAYGTETARLLVYRTPWMGLLLILLALNVAAAAFDRLPWKRKHVGFVVTHAGILVMLAGSLMTQAYGIEGQMAIQEGEAAHRIVLSEPLLQVFSEKGPLGFFPILPRAFPWKGQKRLHADPNIWLVQYLPKTRREEKVESAERGSPALQVTLESSFMKVSHWLFLDDPERNHILLGPADLRFSREAAEKPKESPASGNGELEFQFSNASEGSRSIRLPIPGDFSKPVRLKETPYSVSIQQIFRDAVVEGKTLTDRSREWKNPACELVLEGKGLKERHTVFSNFPDFPTVHGLKPSEFGVRIFYHRNEKSQAGPRNELRFVWKESSLPRYQLRKGDSISEGEGRLGEFVRTGWMDFKFRVERYFPHGRLQAAFSPVSLKEATDRDLSAVQVEVEEGGQKKSFWLGEGDREEFRLGRKHFQLMYGLRTLPVGFRLKLRDFRLESYPGTRQPASFESDVTVQDDFAGISKEATIRMNQPLKYHGFKIFQSGYQQEEGSPEVSIFTVAKDPGIPVKYGGAILLIGGILTMFYSRRFSNREKETEGIGARNEK